MVKVVTQAVMKMKMCDLIELLNQLSAIVGAGNSELLFEFENFDFVDFDFVNFVVVGCGADVGAD